MQASLQLIFMHAPYSGSFAVGSGRGGGNEGDRVRYSSFVVNTLDIVKTERFLRKGLVFLLWLRRVCSCRNGLH